MRLIYISIFLVLLANPVSAQTTGALDGLMLEQLILQVEQAYEQVDRLTDSLNVSKRMEEYEKLKTVKKLSQEGVAIRDLYRKTQTLSKEFRKFRNDPLGTKDTAKELAWLRKAMDDAKDNPNAMKAYSSIMIDLETLDFLGKAQKESEKKIAAGTNDQDNLQISATNNMIMSKILLTNEQRQVKRAANDVNIITTVLSGASYKQLSEPSK